MKVIEHKVTVQITGQQCEGTLTTHVETPAVPLDLKNFTQQVRRSLGDFNVVFDLSVIDMALYQCFAKKPAPDPRQQRNLREDLRDLRVRQRRLQLDIEAERAKPVQDRRVIKRLRSRQRYIAKRMKVISARIESEKPQ